MSAFWRFLPSPPIGVYGVALAGWSSNSKYSLLGGLRSSAQMVSYELSLTLSVVGVLLLAGTFNLSEIIMRQSGYSWGFLPNGTCSARPCRSSWASSATSSPPSRKPTALPFDLAEAESELVAGFHTEYSSFKFAMFFLGEYASMITVACLATILFFGGWLSPFPQTPASDWTRYVPAAVLAIAGMALIIDGVRYMTIWPRSYCPCLGLVLCALSFLFSRPGIIEVDPGAVLVSAQSLGGAVRLRVGALDAAALPLRSTDALRLEVPVSAGAAERGADQPGRGDAQMTPQLVVFLVLAAVAVAGAVNLILQRHPIHSALSLIVVMVALAGLYLLLEAEFIAAIQIIVYAGAIMVLFVFVIMLLNAGAEERTNLSRMARYVGVPLAIVLAGRTGLPGGRRDFRRMTAQPAAERRDARTIHAAVPGFRVSV